MKASYKDLPAKIVAVGNGSFLYRQNIVEVTNQEDEVSYECDEFVIAGAISREDIVRTVINDLYGQGLEQKLINDYNASVNGILPVGAGNEYLSYLEDRKVIKQTILDDWNEYLNESIS